MMTSRKASCSLVRTSFRLVTPVEGVVPKFTFNLHSCSPVCAHVPCVFLLCFTFTSSLRIRGRVYWAKDFCGSRYPVLISLMYRLYTAFLSLHRFPSYRRECLLPVCSGENRQRGGFSPVGFTLELTVNCLGVGHWVLGSHTAVHGRSNVFQVRGVGGLCSAEGPN